MRAQTYLQSIGSPAFSTQLPVENGYIDASNGRLHLEIPMGSYPQRAGGQAVITLMYDSNIWTNASGSWQHNNVSSWGGWRIVDSRSEGSVNYTQTGTGACNLVPYRTDFAVNWTWTAPDGTVKTFSGVKTAWPDQPNDCTGQNTPNSQAWADDASGYWMAVTGYWNAVVYAPDGTIVNGGSTGGVTDSNGNYDGNFGSTDTLGRQLMSCSGSNPEICTLASVQGTTSTFKIYTTTINANTNFGQSTECSGSSNPPCSLTVVNEVDLPDGSKYTFGYDSGTSGTHWGLLNSMTMPTGAQITYLWSRYTDSQGNNYPWISKRTTPDSPTGWTYTPQVVTTCGTGQVNCQQTFTVAEPSGDHTVYTFALNGGAWKNQVQAYNGSVSPANLLSTVSDCWNFVTINNGVCQYSTTTNSPATGVQKLAESTTLPVPGGTTITKTTQYTYDSYGNISKIQENNYYLGNLPSTVDRTTSISYLNGTAYINAVIVNRPTIVTVTNSHGATVSQTVYNYDQSSLTSVTGMPNHDDTNYGTGNTVRGNLTLVQRWTGSGSTYVTKTMTYDTTGEMLTATDWSNGHATTFTYSATYKNAYPTSIKNALNQSTTLGYDLNTGLLTSIQDPNDLANSRAGTTFSYDNMGRPLATNYPDGGQTSLTYNYSGGVYSGLTSTKKMSSSQNMASNTNVDPLGRAASQVLTSDPAGQDTVATTYDSNGRVATVSNPYRSTSDPTYGIETLGYDGLDRALSQKHADGNYAYTYYGSAVSSNGGASTSLCGILGYPVLTVDEAGKKRQAWTDGFGRTVEVDEPDSNSNLTVPTCYGYDLNNNLTSTIQSGSRQRTYMYDALSRLTQAMSPESGTLNYTYDSNGNMLTKTDAKNAVTTFCYDVLNRLTGKRYASATCPLSSPDVLYTYDLTQTSWGESTPNSIGRLSLSQTNSSAGCAVAVFGYDAVGRIAMRDASSPRICGSGSYSTTAMYDLAGDITSLTYPSGRVIKMQYNGAMQPTQVQLYSFGGTSVGYNYLSGASYAPTGAPTSLTLGSGAVESESYNNRLQPCNLQVASGTFAWLNRTNSFYPTPGTNCQPGSGGNNGNVVSITDNLQANRTQSFTYDSLNRISTAQSAATSGVDCWGQSFGYDVWANLLSATATKSGCSMTQLSIGVNAQNQITNSGISYDADGDMLKDGVNTYTYDAENRIATVNGSGATYSYDPEGRRVEKNAGGVTTEYAFFNGQPIAERHPNGDWSDYIYAGSRRLARADDYEDRIQIWGTACSNCGTQWYQYSFPNAGGLAGYTIQQGDVLEWRQWQDTSTSAAGIDITFTNGGSDSSGLTDQNGMAMGTDTSLYVWNYRRVFLNTEAGRTVSQFMLNVSSNTRPGAWNILYQSIVLISADGTVRTVYDRGTTVSLSGSGSSGMTGATYQVNHCSCFGAYPDETTSYYHGDHLGSARLMTNNNGYPTWSATYLPFGQEWNPQSTVNHYKFTGYERDSESGNDNAEARYYASQYDRFLTPDPLGIISADLTDPQSLNEYVYVDDDPTDLTDPSGLDFNCIENPDGPGVVCWDGGLGGGGGEGGSTGVRPPLKPSQVKPPAPKPHRKRLKVVSDCLDGNGRWIDYKLVNDDGTPTEGQFSVTEHVTEQGGNFVHQSTDYPNVFNDFLGGLLFVGQSTNHLQSFTIAPGRGSAGGTPVPIQYLNGSLYGSQGIFIKNTGAQYPVILVNGAQASTVAPPGKKCPSDNK